MPESQQRERAAVTTGTWALGSAWFRKARLVTGRGLASRPLFRALGSLAGASRGSTRSVSSRPSVNSCRQLQLHAATPTAAAAASRSDVLIGHAVTVRTAADGRSTTSIRRGPSLSSSYRSIAISIYSAAMSLTDNGDSYTSGWDGTAPDRAMPRRAESSPCEAVLSPAALIPLIMQQ